MNRLPNNIEHVTAVAIEPIREDPGVGKSPVKAWRIRVHGRDENDITCAPHELTASDYPEAMAIVKFTLGGLVPVPRVEPPAHAEEVTKDAQASHVSNKDKGSRKPKED
jgi:hypothetical protein